MPRCEACNRDFATEEALMQHNKDKHGTGLSRHEIKQAKKQEKEEKKKAEQEKISKKRKIKTVTLIAVVVSAVLALAAFIIYLPKPEATVSSGIGPVGSTHQHADFKVYINGQALDFSSPRYQVRAREVHVEGGDGDLIHKHATGITVGHFFRTINFKINSTCIVTDGNQQYCSNENATLKYFIKTSGKDWEVINDLSNYEIRDLNKYLITYGNETEFSAQQNSVTDKAQIESRGAPGHTF